MKSINISYIKYIYCSIQVIRPIKGEIIKKERRLIKDYHIIVST